MFLIFPMKFPNLEIWLHFDEKNTLLANCWQIWQFWKFDNPGDLWHLRHWNIILTIENLNSWQSYSLTKLPMEIPSTSDRKRKNGLKRKTSSGKTGTISRLHKETTGCSLETSSKMGGRECLVTEEWQSKTLMYVADDRFVTKGTKRKNWTNFPPLF